MASLLVFLMLLVNIQILPTPAAAQTVGDPCIQDGPPSGAYVAEVCITTPEEDGGFYSGDVATSVTVTAVSGVLPDIEVVRFYFNRTEGNASSSLLSDYAEPWGLQIPTSRWRDDRYRLEVSVRFKDKFETPTTNKARMIMNLRNGVTSDPQSNGTWAPRTSGNSPLTVAAIGDGAGGLPGATNVGNLVAGMNPDLFLYLGDVYNAGKYSEFYNYYEPTLGALKGRTNPVPGNHEAGGDQFQGYMDYWDSDKHYYKYDSGGWHFIALDSTREFGQTAAGSAQYNWLAQDLAANANTACTMVYFHHPRNGITSIADEPDKYTRLQDIWSLLSASGVDVVVNGHEHNYQRWQPLDANGQPATNGMIQFTSGAGGHTLGGIGMADSRIATKLRVDGALKFSLTPTGGSAQFIDTAGSVRDSTSFTCHDGAGEPIPQPITLEPVADAMVQQNTPDANVGKINSMRSDLSPNEQTYLRFDVQGASEPITSAKLRLWVRDGTADAPAIATSSDVTWSETGITWNTKPATGTPGPDLGAVAANTWIEYDVTSLVTGNGPVTLVLVPQSNDALSVNTRENTTNRPQLVINNEAPPPPPPPPPPPGETTEFLAAADARVCEANPTTNYGTSSTLQADAGTGVTVESYLKFSVTGYTGAPTSAKVRLFVGTGVNAGSADGPALYSATSTFWAESGITWDTKPGHGTTVLGDLGPVSAGTWVEYDVSSVVTGNGDYSFALATTSTDATDFSSRETTNQPRLVLGGTSEPPPPPPPPSGDALTLQPVADAMVQEAFPVANNGLAPTLHADLGPSEMSYLRFDVQGAPESIASATLRMWVRSGTADAPAVATSSDVTWSETGITWNTRPATGTPGADLGRVGNEVWIEYDVTSLVTGNGPVTLALIPQSTDGISVTSKENTTNRPQLVINGGSGPVDPPPEPPVDPPPSGSAPVLLAAGDIASCSTTADDQTAALLDGLDGTVATLGDHAYPNGTLSEFNDCYGSSWGRHKARTRPAPGNHDYLTADASGYYTYFGTAAGQPGQGYYSYDIGNWHVIVLNSEISTATGSAQEQWLRADLAANPVACTVAYWHKPLYSSASQREDPLAVQPLWQALYDGGAEVVLNGHEHLYERFTPMDPDGNADSTYGLRQFVVGTGGAGHYGFGTVSPYSEARNADTFGVLKLSLDADGYRWEFLPVAGGTYTDSGSGSCHGPAPKEPDLPGGTTLEPVADAMVMEAVPDANSGTVMEMHADLSPNEMSYLRFDVPSSSEPITGATLRLWVQSGTVDAPAIAPSTDVTWSETGITWNTRPAVGTPGADLGAANTGTWIEYDVTGLVSGGGPVTLALIPQSNDGISLNTRENSTNKPELIISGESEPVDPPPDPPTDPPADSTLAFEPVADAMVLQAVPDGNNGLAPSLHADLGPPDEMSYLRFDVQTDGAPISQATLRLWVRLNGGTANAPAVAASDDISWTETGITWNTKPAVGAPGADLGAVGESVWIEYDVTSLVTGDGPVTLALVPQTADGISINSRENATSRPELVITTSGEPGTLAAPRSVAPAAVSADVIEEPAATPVATGPAATPVPSEAATEVPIETESPPQTGTVVNTGGEGVRCRVSPSADGAIITVVPEGSTITLRGAQEGEWLPVSCDGQDGYVSAQYIEITEGTAPVTATTEPTAGEEAPIETASATSEAPVETVVTTEVPTEAGEIPVETPTPTPYSVLSGWQTDPNMPWTLVTDNDPATVWTATIATAPDRAELGFDLGSVVPVDHLSVLPTGPLTGTVELQLSHDGVNWYSLTTVRLEQLEPNIWLDLPIQYYTRYTRLIITNPAGVPSVGSLAEIRVWIEPNGTAQALNLLPRVTPTPVPTEAPTEVPVTPAVETPPTEVPVAPAPTEVPVIEPTPVPTPVPEEPPPSAPEEPPADDTLGEPGTDPGGTAGGT